MSFLFGLGRDLDLSLFVTPVSPQALFKKKILVKCFVSVVFLCFLEPSSLHILRKLYGQATSPTLVSVTSYYFLAVRWPHCDPVFPPFAKPPS